MSEPESVKSKAVVLFLTALLAFLGAVGGTFISGYIQRQSWERDKLYEHQQRVLAKRMELIEKTVRVMNSQKTAKLHMTALELDLDIRRVRLHVAAKGTEEEKKSIGR